MTPSRRRGFASALFLVVLLTVAPPIGRAQVKPARHAMRGMVLQVDPPHHAVVISHDSIPGVMAAMTMRFDVRNARELNGLVPGAIVSFTLVVGRESAHIERVLVVRYESVEQDPVTARRLRLLHSLTAAATTPLPVGQAVPDFTLIDQTHVPISLSGLRGKVVALNFVYTSCVLPQFCYRLASHFAVLQRRLSEHVGRDLVLLTITFDPARDTPERLAEYARQWDADPAAWHFLTGNAADIRRVTGMFGIDAYPDEGLISHSTRTAVIDRRGILAASIEGNRYSASQLGDLVDSVLARNGS